MPTPSLRALQTTLVLALLCNGVHSQTAVDLIVEGRYVVTMDDAFSVIEDGAVAIAGGEIVAVDRAASVHERYSAKRTIAGDNQVLMPGLINGHTHASMVLFRGIADDLDLMTFLYERIFPVEGRFVDAGFVRTGMQLACYEFIKGGTTSFVNMYFYPGIAAEVVKDCGLRAILSAPLNDYPSPGHEGWDDSLASGVKYVKAWKGKHSRITPGFSPHAPYTVSPDHYAQVAAIAKTLEVPVTTHLSEDAAERDFVVEAYDTTSIKHLERTGLFQNQVIAAHVVVPTDDELSVLATADVGVIHNPTSNLKTGAGIAPVTKMLAAGIDVGLGTDGAASNNDLDLWEEIRLAALLQKGRLNDPTVMPAASALKMATSGGAAAIGFQDQVGRLAVGLRADMIQLTLDDLRSAPVYDIISHLVYVMGSRDVVTTIVDGQVLMQDGEVLTIDRERVAAEVRAFQSTFSEFLGEE
ncbi:MAG: amidohydrolase family protein [Pseudomonadota bacterium]